MATSPCDVGSLVDAFAEAKILTKKQLLARFGCPWTAIVRLLKGLGYLTSYNHNARYYTLVSVARFDGDGLWSHGTVRFSRDGTLTGTLVGLVGRSEGGLYADDLRRLLQVDVRPTLGRLVGSGRLARHKMGRRFLYVDIQSERAQAQIAERRAEVPPTPGPSSLPEPATVAALLVERIKTPDVEPEVAARRLRRRGVAVTPAQARAVFAHYGLLKKKRLT